MPPLTCHLSSVIVKSELLLEVTMVVTVQATYDGCSPASEYQRFKVQKRLGH